MTMAKAQAYVATIAFWLVAYVAAHDKVLRGLEPGDNLMCSDGTGLLLPVCEALASEATDREDADDALELALQAEIDVRAHADEIFSDDILQIQNELDLINLEMEENTVSIKGEGVDIKIPADKRCMADKVTVDVGHAIVKTKDFEYPFNGQGFNNAKNKQPPPALRKEICDGLEPSCYVDLRKDLEDAANVECAKFKKLSDFVTDCKSAGALVAIDPKNAAHVKYTCSSEFKDVEDKTITRTMTLECEWKRSFPFACDP